MHEGVIQIHPSNEVVDADADEVRRAYPDGSNPQDLRRGKRVRTTPTRASSVAAVSMWVRLLLRE